ncbi:SDR family NAD(P)-dependent oxidoreductase [Streptomyces sp. NPDC059176]|uniref:SDR family NAD(P)-dependent oxidoreductase n=1 Tax=unclassified Streptomyces TaxID=2593676 RepID=UPI00369B61FB
MVSDSLQNKVVVVVGGDARSTATIATELSRRGALLAIQYDASFADAKHLVRGIEKEGGHAIAVRADLTDAAQTEALYQRTVGALGAMDAVVVNTADTAGPAAHGRGGTGVMDVFEAIGRRMCACVVPARAAVRTFASLRQSGALVYLTAGCGLDDALARTVVRHLAAEVRPPALRVNVVAGTGVFAAAAAPVVDLVAALTSGDLSRLDGAVLSVAAAPLAPRR